MIVYSGSFDVSRPNGPGVNEQLFVMSLARVLGDTVRFVIPRPAGSLPSTFPCQLCTLLPPLDGRSPVSWLRQQSARLRALRRIDRQFRPELYVIRPDVLPLADLRFHADGLRTYCVKNAHLSARRNIGVGPKGVLLRVHYHLLERLLRGANLVDVVSDVHRRDILRATGLAADQVIVVDNAVDTGTFKPRDKAACRRELGLTTHSPLIGYVGQIAASRGASEMVRALPRLAAEFPHVAALVVEGGGSSMRELSTLARSLGVEQRLILRGPVALAEVPRYIGALDVAVSFRLDDGCSELKVRQYVACGRPVVASARVNAFLETHGLGTLVRREDEDEVASALAAWAREGMDVARGAALSERLCRYARDHLDMDAANRRRLDAWRAVVSKATQASR